MADVSTRPEQTTPEQTTLRRQPNLLLVGYEDDDTILRPTLAEEWLVCTKTIRSYQRQGLPHFLEGGKTAHRVGSAREFMRKRERGTGRRASRSAAA